MEENMTSFTKLQVHIATSPKKD